MTTTASKHQDSDNHWHVLKVVSIKTVTEWHVLKVVSIKIVESMQCKCHGAQSKPNTKHRTKYPPASMSNMISTCVVSRMLEKFKNDVEKQQVEQMMDWQTKLVMMDSKERQYILQVSNYKVNSILYDLY